MSYDDILLYIVIQYRAFAQIYLFLNFIFVACGHPECEGQSVRLMRELVRMAKENGFDIRDVSPDGNCMFAAIVDQLSMYGDSRFDSKSLREAAVYWLIEHPLANDGTHYSNFISGDWESYLQKMVTYL